VGIAGTGVAFAYGAGLGSDPVPPPAPAAPALAAQGAPVLAGVSQYPLASYRPGVVPLAGQPSASAATDLRAEGLAADGIPRTALEAYQDAASREAIRRPLCRLPWQLPAAIGRVESDHGRFNHAVLYANGVSSPPIIGIPLNGNGTALIRDTDHGAMDGDKVYDRAVGPMQFIPSTWASYGVDADGDGAANPFDIFDAAASAADYLCAAGGDLGTARGQQRAVSAYNHSSAYVELVLRIERIYSDGTIDFGAPADPPPPPDVPPAAPGPPLSAGDPGGSTTPGPSSSSGATSTLPAPSSSAPASGSAPPSSAPPTSGPPTDASPSDSGPSDAGSTDAAPTDAAPSDTALTSADLTSAGAGPPS